MTRFPHRNTGGPNNLPAAEWVAEQLRGMGYQVRIDTWTETLYGKRTELHNVIAERPGTGEGRLLFSAHLDHAPTTIQGADNDGSGVGILLHLAEVLAAQRTQHAVAFLFADAEEYGMLGVRRFAATDRRPVDAAIVVDNAGKASAFGFDPGMVGQGRGYTPLGLYRLLQDLAPAVTDWKLYALDPVWQVIERSVALSFTDQGPLVGRGIPAITIGATGVWGYYHTPQDTIDRLSAASLEHVGRLLEAFTAEMEAGTRFDRGDQYLYLPNAVPGAPGRYVPGWALRLVLLRALPPLAGPIPGVRGGNMGIASSEDHLLPVCASG